MTTDVRPVLDRAAPAGVLGGAVVGVGGVAVVALSAPEFAAVTAVPILVGGLLAVIDQRTTRIATRHVAVLAVLTLVACALGIALDRGSWASVLLGAGIWAVPLFVLALFAGFGGGDFKYALCLGAVTGWVSLSAAVTGLLLGVLVAALAGVVVAARERTTRAQVALGLPLFVGAVASIALQGLLA